MTVPTILIIFLATISLISSILLSERSKTSFSEILSHLKQFQPLWPTVSALCIALTVLTSLYSAFGFLAGILIFIISSLVESKINAEKTNAALFTLFTSSFSVLSLSVAWFISPNTTTLITLFAGTLLFAWYKKIEFVNSEILRGTLFASLGILGAHYFYGGSQIATQFILLLLALGCAGMVISIFAATHYGQSTPKQMFHIAGTTFFVAACATAGWIIPFKPMNIAVCILLGAIATFICVRTNKTWVRNTILITTLLSSYFVAEFYGIIVAFISFGALSPNTSLLSNAKTHIKTIIDYLFILLIPIFIHSIAASGKSLLFEIGNPFLIGGILLSLLVIWSYRSFISSHAYSNKRLLLIIPLSFLIGLVSIILFKENNGAILLTGILVGLILQEIILSNEDTSGPGHKNLTLLFFVSSFLFTNFLFS